MPILINRESGLAENVPDQNAQQALQDTHDIALLNPQGEPVSAPAAQLSQLMQQGYQKPSEQHFQQLMDHAKYSSTGQQIAAGAEAAGSALSFGATTGLERMMGVPAKDIQGREETNPEAHMAGTAVGLGAGMLTGSGEAAVLEGLGNAVAPKAAALFGETALGRVGTAATKAAIENMAFSTGDEASKMFMSDPNQSMETAMANIGMSGVLGGVLGGGLKGTGELWNLGPGAKIEQTLEAIKNRSAGLPSELKTAANLSIAPEIETALGNTPEAQHMAATLMESNSTSGAKFQNAMRDFHEQLGTAATEAVGKTPEQIAELGESSKYETGKQFQDKLAATIKEKVEPIAQKYEEFQQKFKTAEISPETRLKMANDITQAITDNGLLKGPNESALKLAQKVLGQLDNQATAQDLRTYIQGLNSIAPYGSENYQIAKQLRGILGAGQEAAIEASAAGSDTYAAFKSTQGEYSKFKGLLEDLNDRLHLGKEAKYGATGFLGALKDMDPESVVNRLKLKDDVGLQNLLAEQFPEVHSLVKQQELDSILKKAINKTGDGLDVKKLFKQLDSLSPELKANIIPEEQLTRLEALKDLSNRVPAKMNPSGTARTLDALWSKMPASAGAMTGMMLGHNPVFGAILGGLAHYAGREAPDAVKLAMLKFMGSEMPTNATAFQAAVKVAGQMLKGEQKLNKAATAVFEGSEIQGVEVSAKEIEKLSKQVDELSADPTALLEQDNNMAHYLPDHAPVISMAAVRNLQYLATLRPNTAPLGPLDPMRVANSTEQSKYDNALAIAQNPLLVMKKIKNGNLTIDDMQHLNAMYPALAGRMRDKLGQQMIDHKSRNGSMPYVTKLSLSAFMSQPLDSSMTPAAIMAAQPQIMQQSHIPKNGMMRPSQSGLKNLSKLPGSYMTPSQHRQSYRAGKH